METLGIFSDPLSAGNAVAGLIRAGFVESQITSLSSVPYPDGVLTKGGARGWFHFVTLAGAAAGAVAGFGLAAGTAWLYPVQTGDKPIIAPFPASIVTFEVTMLFALVGTMAGMFLEMKLRRSPAPRLYDPSIAEGCIGISLTFHGPGEVVVCGPEPEDMENCIGSIAVLSVPEQEARAEEIMRKAGALRTIREVTQ